MTKRLWKIHSWLGLISGIALLVIGITGSLLVFRNELDLLVNPDYVRMDLAAGERKPLDELVTRVRATLPNHEVTGWLLPRETDLADLAYVTRHGENEPRIAFVNPRTGEIRGGTTKWNATLSGWLLELHYSFFADHAGVFIVGIFAVILCLLGLTGLWLYRDFWRNFFKLRWRASARIFFSDLHKTIGITSVAFNLILGFTGAYWNLPDAIGHFISGEAEEPTVTRHFYSDTVSFDKLIAQATKKIPGFQPTYLSLPEDTNADIVVYGAATSNPFRSDYGSFVSFDAQTGALKTATDIRQSGWWAQTTDAFYPLHFGSFGGLPVKILWCLGGLAPGLLAVSGSVIWWKRRQRKSVSL